MIELSDYGKRVVLRINLIGMWLSVLISIRNFSVCLRQYKKTRGKIHLVNMAQVLVLGIHRFMYGIIPLFEISTCAYFPLLVSFWHLTYLLFYVVMFMRLVILELDRYSRWIKCVGILLIGLRFADWPYELAFVSIQKSIMAQTPGRDATCWAEWGSGVIILNFVGDALANLFLSGMFIRRLFIHINSTKTLHSESSKLIGSIAKKSLICLALTFVVNLIMNLLKVTRFLGPESDAFTVYFELIESTLLVEALRNDSSMRAGTSASICGSCHKELSRSAGHKRPNQSEEHHSQMLVKSFGEKSKNEYNKSDIEDNLSCDNRTVECADKTIENIAPVEPVMFNPRHPAPPFPASFSTSLAPRPTLPIKKDGLFQSNDSTSMTSTKLPSNESFIMNNMRTDQEGFDHAMTLSSNSNYSQSSHYWKGKPENL